MTNISIAPVNLMVSPDSSAKGTPVMMGGKKVGEVVSKCGSAVSVTITDPDAMAEIKAGPKFMSAGYELIDGELGDLKLFSEVQDD